MTRSLQGVVHDEGLTGPTGLTGFVHRYGTKSVTEAIRAQTARLQATAGPFTFPAQIVTGGAAALGGSVEVTINPDKSVRWKGHMHDSGADGYDFAISAMVRTPGDTVSRWPRAATWAGPSRRGTATSTGTT